MWSDTTIGTSPGGGIYLIMFYAVAGTNSLVYRIVAFSTNSTATVDSPAACYIRSISLTSYGFSFSHQYTYPYNSSSYTVDDTVLIPISIQRIL